MSAASNINAEVTRNIFSTPFPIGPDDSNWSILSQDQPGVKRSFRFGGDGRVGNLLTNGGLRSTERSVGLPNSRQKRDSGAQGHDSVKTGSARSLVAILGRRLEIRAPGRCPDFRCRASDSAWNWIGQTEDWPKSELDRRNWRDSAH